MPFCGHVIVLRAEHSTAYAVLGLRSGIAEDRENAGMHAAKYRGNVRQPLVRASQIVYQAIKRFDVWEVKALLLPAAVRRVPHPSRHPWTIARPTDMRESLSGGPRWGRTRATTLSDTTSYDHRRSNCG